MLSFINTPEVMQALMISFLFFTQVVKFIQAIFINLVCTFKANLHDTMFAYNHGMQLLLFTLLDVHENRKKNFHH